jgi:hypothetical protein
LRADAEAQRRTNRATEGVELEFSVAGGGAAGQVLRHNLGYAPTRMVVVMQDRGNGPVLFLAADNETVTVSTAGTFHCSGVVRVY